MIFPESEKRKTIERYSSRYQKFGYSPKSLGWDKGKQSVRFSVLTSQYNFSGKSILDIGCGFGDLNKTLSDRYEQSYSYLGIDIVPDLIYEAQKHYIGNHIRFKIGDFLAEYFTDSFDYIIASGIFNYHLDGISNYQFIEATMDKAMSLAKDGIAFDFLSDKVDYKLESTFHSSPETILAMAYQYSRNVVLKNDYMPFEFSIFLFKDDSFSSEDTLFTRFKRENKEYYSGKNI